MFSVFTKLSCTVLLKEKKNSLKMVKLGQNGVKLTASNDWSETPENNEEQE